ncbi:MAG: hypothetical protein ACOCXQ_04055 [Patescibacteria group bacterium]
MEQLTEQPGLDPETTGVFSGQEALLKTAIQYLARRAGEIDVQVKPNSTEAHFIHEPRPTIVLGDRLGEELQLNPEHAFFVAMHEASHYAMALEDWKGLQNYWKIYDQYRGKPNEGRYCILFNQILDIPTNARTRRVPILESGGRFEDIPRLNYREKHPYTSTIAQHENPLSVQFANIILRAVMDQDVTIISSTDQHNKSDLSENHVIVSPEVLDVINRPVSFFGQTYPDLITFARNASYSTNTGYNLINKHLTDIYIPLFEELLQNDPPQSSKDSQLSPGENDQTNPKTMEEVEEHQKKKNETPEQRKKQKEQEELKKRHPDANPDQVKKMWDILQATEQAAQHLEKIWWHLMERTAATELVEVTGFKKGRRINPTALSQKLPVLLTNPDAATIMSRTEEIVVGETIKPKRIVLFLARDMSGSMNDDEKQQAVTDVLFTIAKSLALTMQEGLNKFDTSFPMQAEIVWLDFGDTVKERLHYSLTIPPTPETSPTGAIDSLLQVATSVKEFLNGNSADCHAISDPIDMINKHDWKGEDTLPILFMLTDGGTDTEEQSIQALKEWDKIGGYPRAIQIGASRLDNNEIESFANVWQDKGKALQNHDYRKLYDLLYNLLEQIIVTASP